MLYSPDLDSCLDGITRRTILDLASELDIPFEIKKLKVEDVLEADESFFSGTAAEVVPINSLDDKPIGSGLRGPITEKLQSAYFDQVRGVREKTLLGIPTSNRSHENFNNWTILGWRFCHGSNSL